MDPDEALRNLRALVIKALESDDTPELASEIAEQFDHLDSWLSAKGFLPKAWSQSSPGNPSPNFNN